MTLKPQHVPLIVAHRGASALAPENTLSSFRRAVEIGADGVEFDVRLAKDGVPVVIHDANLMRTGRRDEKVADLTSAELAEVDVGSWFNQAYKKRASNDFSADTVPTLEAVLEELRGFRGLIFIELKCRDAETEALCRAVCSVITPSPLLPQIIVKSFKLSVIPNMRFRCPGVKTAALFAPKVMRFLRKEKHLVRIASELGADHISVHRSLVTRKFMKKVAKTNLSVTVWTADNPRWVKKAMELGVATVITNNPARLLAKRKEILKNNKVAEH
jgi:glycerophosphoryl diester phosphodiesterase